YISPDLGPQLSLVGAKKVSIDSNNGVLIDTPFSPLIDTTNELSTMNLLGSVMHGELSFRMRPNIFRHAISIDV
ncbi:hypothetical protein IGI04_002427, partial [Brassica rapa subsp. trilocularis]